METVLEAVIPVFALIWIGFACKRWHMPGDAFWPLAERMTYFIFLPSLFFRSILHADFEAAGSLPALIGAVITCFILTSLSAFIIQFVWLKLDGKRFASFFQSTFRFNNYVGLPIIMLLYGDAGVAIYAIIISLAIPIANILSVTVMCHFASEQQVNIKKLGYSIITNPQILSPIAGLVVNIFNIPLFYAGNVIDFFAACAAPLGLLAVGAGIDFKEMTSSKRNMLSGVFMKNILNPLMMAISCFMWGISGTSLQIAIIYAALPVAASSFILAKQFGAHGPLSISIIIASTLASMITLTGLLLYLNG